MGMPLGNRGLLVDRVGTAKGSGANRTEQQAEALGLQLLARRKGEGKPQT